MGAFSTFKVMSVDNLGSDNFSFRTTRACFTLGLLFMLAGLGIVFQLIAAKYSHSLPAFCAVCFIVAVVFMICGITLMVYKRRVCVSEGDQKIEVVESCLTGSRKAVYHFSEITNIELVRDNKCIFSLHAKLWIVRAYVKHYNTIFTEKLFACMNLSEARKVAERLSYTTHANIVVGDQNTHNFYLNSGLRHSAKPQLRTLS